MADIVELYSYEAQIEPALAALLRNAGINAFQEFSSDTKDTPFVDISLVHIRATGHTKIIRPGVQYWDAWQGRCLFRTYTQRGKNSGEQAHIMGTIRSIAVEFASLLPRAVLPFHAIDQFREAEETSLARGYNREENLDWSELRFDLTWNIRADVW
jgi:hypothetical protein